MGFVQHCFWTRGYLLQRHNRDTQRFAFKCSAQLCNNLWKDIFKEPLDQSKKSKKGLLKLIKNNGYQTISQKIDEQDNHDDLLFNVFTMANSCVILVLMM